MSSITEVEFVELLQQTRLRLLSKTNSNRILEEFSPDIPDCDDQGLVMKIDSRLPTSSVPPVTLAVAGLALSPTSILQSLPDILLKKLVQIELFQKEATRLLPVFLYASLLLLGFQATAVLVLLSHTLLPLGLWFLLGCSGVLIVLFLSTTFTGLIQTPTPPPTPSHSSTSLSNYAS